MKGFFIAAIGGLMAAGGVIIVGNMPTMDAPGLALAAALMGGTTFGVILAFLRA